MEGRRMVINQEKPIPRENYNEIIDDQYKKKGD